MYMDEHYLKIWTLGEICVPLEAALETENDV